MNNHLINVLVLISHWLQALHLSFFYGIVLTTGLFYLLIYIYRKKTKYSHELTALSAAYKNRIEKIEKEKQALLEENACLHEKIRKLSKARIMDSPVSYDEFKQIYPDEASCFQYLTEVKWGNGFFCKKCGNTKYNRGNTMYSRRCTRCGYIESITANTIFYRLKFSIQKAFYMLSLIYDKPDITANELSEAVNLRKQTCWTFKNKVRERIKKKKKESNWTDLMID